LAALRRQLPWRRRQHLKPLQQHNLPATDAQVATATAPGAAIVRTVVVRVAKGVTAVADAVVSVAGVTAWTVPCATGKTSQLKG